MCCRVWKVRAWHGVTLGVLEEITIEKLAPDSLFSTWLRPTGCGGIAVDEEHEDVHQEVKDVMGFLRLPEGKQSWVMDSLLKHEDQAHPQLIRTGPPWVHH